MLSSMGAVLLVMGALVVVLLIGVALYFALKHIRASNESLRGVTQLTAQRVTRLRRIAVSCTDDECADRIEQAADAIRFSDSAIVLEVDAEIDKAISSLMLAVGADDAPALRGSLTRVEGLIGQRAAEVACVRKGSF